MIYGFEFLNISRLYFRLYFLVLFLSRFTVTVCLTLISFTWFWFIFCVSVSLLFVRLCVMCTFQMCCVFAFILIFGLIPLFCFGPALPFVQWIITQNLFSLNHLHLGPNSNSESGIQCFFHLVYHFHP